MQVSEGYNNEMVFSMYVHLNKQVAPSRSNLKKFVVKLELSPYRYRKHNSYAIRFGCQIISITVIIRYYSEVNCNGKIIFAFEYMLKPKQDLE